MLSRMTLRLKHRAFSKACNIPEIIASHRSLHVTCKFRDKSLHNTNFLNLSRHRPILAGAFVRYASSGDDKIPENLLDAIPDPPLPPAPEVLDAVQAAGGSTLKALGLGGYSPIGLVQHSLEWLHVTMDIPWWGAIFIGTLCVRILIFPLVIKVQKNAARMQNESPRMVMLQTKMTDARQAGNDLDAAKYGQELMKFMKEKDVNPLKNMMVPMAQAPLFISFFLGLRGMAKAPVESMKEGGLWWFTDLTVADPYYILPLVTCGTMYLTIVLGTDGAKLDTMNIGMIKYVIKCVPIVVFPFIMTFPGGVVCYWMATNFISLLQAAFLKIPRVRDFFGIPAIIVHAPVKTSGDKGFVGGFKDSWSNMRVVREIAERAHVDDLRFRTSGRGPVPRTFKYDPTKQAPAESKILTKPRN